MLRKKKDLKPLDSLTKIEASKESHKRAAEVKEVLEAIGQESQTKAIPFVKEKLEFESEEAEEIKNAKLNLLEEKAKFAKKRLEFDPYRKTLCEIMISRVKESRWPKGYHFKALPTPEGVVLLLMTPGGKIYGHGITPTHLPKYDLYAIEGLVMQAENRVDRLEEISTLPTS